jgi:hypothetical protein
MKYSPNLQPVFDTLAPRFKEAAQEAYQEITQLGVPAALIGGMAVGAYGHVRNTKDVDFLIGRPGFRPGRIMTFLEGMPLRAAGVTIDLLPAEEEFLIGALARAKLSEGLPVLQVEPLIAMKLIAWRPKDQSDILGLIEAGVDPTDVAAYLDRNGLPRLLERLTKLLEDQ